MFMNWSNILVKYYQSILASSLMLIHLFNFQSLEEEIYFLIKKIPFIESKQEEDEEIFDE